MNMSEKALTERERELGAIIDAYNEVTEQLKVSHERLTGEVSRLREELARKNRELRRRERLAALGERAAGVAHEIRNPLGGLRMFASLLEKDLRDRPESLRMVGKVAQCVSSLESVVADTLEFARPSEPRSERVRLGPLVSEVVELAQAKTGGGRRWTW
jgi:signal transduction histidine kinase